jgi:hypothetical protein
MSSAGKVMDELPSIGICSFCAAFARRVYEFLGLNGELTQEAVLITSIWVQKEWSWRGYTAIVLAICCCSCVRD